MSNTELFFQFMAGAIINPITIIVIACFFFKNDWRTLIAAPIGAAIFAEMMAISKTSNFSFVRLAYLYAIALIWSLIIYGITYKSRRK